MPPLDFTDLIPDKPAGGEEESRNAQAPDLKRDKPDDGPPDLVRDPARTPPDFFSLVPPTPATKVLDAMKRGYHEAREHSTPLLGQEAQAELDRLREQGGITGGLGRLLGAVAEDTEILLNRPPAIARALQAGAQQLGLELGLNPQLARDIAAFPESRMGEGVSRPREPGPAEAARPRTEPGFGAAPGAPGPEAPPGGAPGGAPGTPGTPRPGIGYDPGLQGDVIPPTAREQPPTVRPEGPIIDPQQQIEGTRALTGPPPDAAGLPAPAGTAMVPAPRLLEGPQPEPPPAQPPQGTPALAGPPQPIALPAPEPAPAPPPAQPEAAPAAPAAEQPRSDAIEAHGGPWTRVKDRFGQDAVNLQGEAVYQNANGARALMENGVPYTERVTVDPERGMVPRDVVNRRGQFLTTEEAGRASETRPPAKSEGPAPQRQRADGSVDPPEKQKTEAGGKTGVGPGVSGQKPGSDSDWKYVGDNEEGDPIYANDQGVHSIVKDGVRIVESVRMRPTREGMVMSVPAPAEKEPAFRPAAEKPESEPKPAAPQNETSAPSTLEPKPVRVSGKNVPGEAPIVRFRKDAAAIEETLPKTEPGMVRLWRGNRPGEVGTGLQFTNDLPGIALPFRETYGGDISYVDVPTADAAEYLNKSGGAPGAEFYVPPEVGASARPVSVTTRGGSTILKPTRDEPTKTEAPHPDAPGPTLAPLRENSFTADDIGVEVRPRLNSGLHRDTGGTITHVQQSSRGPLVQTTGSGNQQFYGSDFERVSAAASVESKPASPESTPVPPTEQMVSRVVDAWNEGGASDALRVIGELKAAHDLTPEQIKEVSTAAERQFYGGDTPEEAPTLPGGPQVVTHVTKKGKTLTGTIRTDLTKDEAKAIDPYSFRKDGGWFIRSKPTAKEPAAEPVFTPEQAATQAGDVAPPDPPPPTPADPAVAEAIDLSQGFGPEPSTIADTPKEVAKLRDKAELTDKDRQRGQSILDDEETEQADRIMDMLFNGWSPTDISESPGITASARDVRAIDEILDQDAIDRSDWFEDSGEPPPSWRPKERYSGLQGGLRFSDAGAGSEGVPATGSVEPDGQAPSGKEPGGPRDAGANPGGQAKKPRGPRVRGGSGGGGRSGVRDTDRLPDTGEGSEPGTTGRPPEPVETQVRGQDFVIGPGDLEESRARMTKARDNVSAIELAKRLTAENAVATLEQQRELVKYVGWGGLKNAFRDSNGNFGQGMEKVGERIEKLLTPDELRTARRSAQYAHYTAEHVIRSMWDTVRSMGFDGGSVFEPGMGIGHFRGLMPPDLAEKTRYRGIEMDGITTDIAKLLYPRSGVRQADFTRMPLPEKSFDLVIGNPPFADVTVTTDPKYAARRFLLHDYFFAKSLDAVRPGGLLAFVTSAGTMNKMDSDAREYLAERGQFLGGVRLPSTAFRENAMTEVTTDILFFKRRPEGRRPLAEIPEEEKSWTVSEPRTLANAVGIDTTANVSRYFSQNPEMVLGEEGFWDKLYEDRYAVRQRPDTDLPTDLRVALSRLQADVMDPPLSLEGQTLLDWDSSEKKDGSYYLAPSGALMQYSGGVGREVQARGSGVKGGMTAGERARVVRLIPVRDALRDVMRYNLSGEDDKAEDARAVLNTTYDRFVKEFGPINKAEISYQRPSIVQQETARFEARENARYAGERWYEGDFDAEPYYRRNANMSEIAAARKIAREAVEREGRVFDEGSFDPDDMPDNIIDRRPNIQPFMRDPESYRLRSIENYDDNTGAASKLEVFFRNPITRYVEPELRSAQDGLLWSLNTLGRFDLPAIADQMNREEEQIVSELGDLVYEQHAAPGTWVTRDEYLSGDVKTKLAEAREAAERDPARYQRNVTALEGGQPEPLPPGRITLVLGMPWVPMQIVQDFVRDHLQLGRPRMNYNPTISRWTVAPSTNWRQTDTASGLPLWSTPRRDAYELLQDALNRTPPKIYNGRGTSDDPRVLDQEATLAAQDKMAAIQNAFFDPETRSGWAMDDDDRANEIANVYNDKLNRVVQRQFNGDYLTTPGISDNWRWRPHQTRVVSRIILEGNTYMGHAVGAGKTSAMIGAGMEMKRLGLVRKPMYVVPNHMLGQFSKEFYQQYPAARIAIADDQQFHTARRRQFMANVAQEDLDAVIITHKSFEKIPLSREFSDELIRKEIEDLVQAIQDARGDRFTVRRLEKMKERLEQRLSRPVEGKDQTITFEEMGVDFLFVDEAHEFRKLPFVTLQSDVKGVDPDGSNMARDLYMKIQYLETQRPGRSAVLASGTPVTNTMGELFSISRYLQGPALAERGLSQFDAWAQTFANTRTELEQNPDGTYKAQTRLSRFVNMPELYKMVGQVMDIVTSQQLAQYVTRPALMGGERQFHQYKPTPEQVRYQEELGRRMRAIEARRGPPQPGDDIILSVINDGRHAAIDPRFVAQTQSDTKSKLNGLLENVVTIWKDTADTQFYDPESAYKTPSFRGPATQMIFTNLGLNGRGPINFSTYDWMREYLRRAGVPASEIAFIKDYKTTTAKQSLFNDMNEGKIRILIGSTKKMGTGVNAQRRLIAVHNLDPLWYPADDEQRNGRILRQGNHNPEIQIHDYATDGSYDSSMWKMMGRKAGFIEQFFRGDPNLRDMEDLGEASMYEQAAAMTTSDPRAMELTQMKQDLKRMILRRDAQRSEQWSLKNKLESHEKEAAYNDARAAKFERDIAQRKDLSGKNFTMTVDGETYTKRDDANTAIAAARDKHGTSVAKGDDRIIGEISGFPIRLYRHPYSNELKVQIIFNGEYDRELSYENPVTSAEGLMRNLEKAVTERRKEADDQRAAAAAIRPLLGQTFTGGEDIDRLDKAVKELEKTLKAESDLRRAELGRQDSERSTRRDELSDEPPEDLTRDD